MDPSSTAPLGQPIREECNNENQKKSQGKRKIEIKLIGKKTSRQVTFSKRRNGLFKKASELCTLCGAEVAIVAFSGAGKLFSFGHPTADSVILRYLNNSSSSSSSSSSSIEGKEVITHIGAEKKMPSLSNVGGRFWWDEPIDENLGLAGLEQLKAALEGLRSRAASRLDDINSSLVGYNNINDSNNAGVKDEQFTDFGCMGWSNFSQAPCDFAWIGHPHQVYNGVDGMRWGLQ